ncbi:MAG: actin cross-linking domain-containing toxin [Actinomycetota bacterium]|nr:actin cross-linking domain-containing toxin [Actinomycetota bacterium]
MLDWVLEGSLCLSRAPNSYLDIWSRTMSIGPDGVGQRPLRRTRSAPNLIKRGPKPARQPDKLHFRLEFLSPSIGTEQELSGVVIKRRKNAGRKIGEVLKNGETLLLITTDMMRSEVDDYQFCTLEIITTPTEGNDGVGWADRTEAFSLLIAEIEDVARRGHGKGGALTSELLGVKSGYLMLICTPDHVISMENPQSNVVVTSTDRQGTFGVPVASMLDPDFHLAGGMPMPDWYNVEAEEWAVTIWPQRPDMQLAYALIESGIGKCAQLMEANQAVVNAVWAADETVTVAADKRAVCYALMDLENGDPAEKRLALMECVVAEEAATKALEKAILAVAKLMVSPDWKNSWKPLPRTPLITVLDQLPDPDALNVLAPLQEFMAQQNDPVINWAKRHILDGYRLGGHDIKVPVIAGQRGFLLEYRGIQPDNFKDKFYYTAGEAGIHGAPVPPKARRAQADAAAAARNRRRHSL